MWQMTAGGLGGAYHTSSTVCDATTEALHIVMPVKVFMRSTASTAATWVSMGFYIPVQSIL